MLKKIQVTKNDFEKLKKFVKAARSMAGKNMQLLQALNEELERAEVVEPEKISADVVTMNSEVIVKDIVTGEEDAYKIVFPEYADISEGKISVVAPLGCALLGYRIHDEIEMITPGGSRRVRVEKILYQPEAAGEFSA